MLHIEIKPTLRVQTNAPPGELCANKEIEPLQGRVRAMRSGNLPPMNTTVCDTYDAPREVFLVADPNATSGFRSSLERPLMICWRLEHTKSSFCVIELTDAKECWVYWGAHIKDMDLSRYEAIVLGTLSLEARRALAFKADEVDVEVRNNDMSYRSRWFMRLLEKAVESSLLDINRARRALTSLRALDLAAVDFSKLVNTALNNTVSEEDWFHERRQITK